MIRLGKNSLWLLAARIGAQALALATLLLARKLGSTGFGEYVFFTTIIFIANVLTTCGTDMYFIREIAARDDLSRLPAALWIQLLLSAFLIAGALAAAPLLPNQSADSILALQIYSLALIPMSFSSVFATALRGKQRMDLYALLNFCGGFMQFLVVWFFMLDGQGVVTLAFLLLWMQFIMAGVSFRMCLSHVDGFWQDWHFRWPDVRAVFLASASLGLLGLLGMVYQKAGVLLLSSLSGAALTGLYASALRVVDAAKLVHFATLTALYPLMARSESSGMVQLSLKLLLAWALALAVGLSVLAAPMVHLLFGEQFTPAAPILRILAWTLPPYTVSSFLSLAFVARNRPRAVGWALTVSLFGLALFSCYWIPAYGLTGAAWATLTAEIIQAVLLIVQVPKLSSLIKKRNSHELSKPP